MSAPDPGHSTDQSVFLSYSSADRPRVNGLRILLESAGRKVFQDHAVIRPGSKWRRALDEGLRDAGVMYVYWTRHASRSDWVRKEYEYFLGTGRALIPLKVDSTPLPAPLAERQAIDLGAAEEQPGAGVALPGLVLAKKKELQARGKSRREIARGVLAWLRDEHQVEVAKKDRKWIFLFLGFPWIWILAQYPGQAARALARGVTERLSQTNWPEILFLLGAVILAVALARKPPPEEVEIPDRPDRPPHRPPAVEFAELEARLDALSQDHRRAWGLAPVEREDEQLSAPQEILERNHREIVDLLGALDLGSIRDRLDALLADHGLESSSESGRRSLAGDHREILDRLDGSAGVDIAAILDRLEVLAGEHGLDAAFGDERPGDDSLRSDHRQIADLIGSLDERCAALGSPCELRIDQPVLLEGRRPANEGNREGLVVLGATIALDGSVPAETIFVVEAETRAGDDEVLSATDALGDWRFEPGRSNGDPVTWPLTVTFRFQVDGEGE